MKQVLLVQLRTNPRSIAREREQYARLLSPDAFLHTVSVHDILHGAVSLHDTARFHDAVIFGGSADFDIDGGRDEADHARATSRAILDAVAPLIDHILERDMPFLGVCYGHQLLAEHCGGTVAHDTAQKKIGTHTVLRTDAGRADPLFAPLPDVFYAQYGHKDSATTHPHGAVVLASSPTCSFAALRYGNNVYTTQFHPELTAKDMRTRLANLPGYVPDASVLEEIFHESPEASRIVRLFCEKIVA